MLMNRHRATWIALAIVIVFIALLTWMAIITPRLQEISADDEQTAQLVSQNNTTQNEIDELTIANGTIILQTNRLNQLRRQIPNGYDQPAFIASLNSSAKDSTVSIQSVSFGTAADASLPSEAARGITASRVVEVPVTISAQGTYDHLRAFVASVQSIERIAVVNSVSYSIGSSSDSSSSGTSTLSLSCTIYSLLDKSETSTSSSTSGD